MDQQQFEQQQLARQVRGIYNYEVGQKAPLGLMLVLIFALAALVFAGASVFSTLSQVAEGLAR